MKRHGWNCLLVSLVVLAAATVPVRGEDGRTISVTGVGRTAISPSHVNIRGTISAGGDSAKEAIAEFAKAKEKLSKALGENEQIKVDFAGEKLASGATADGGAAAAIAFAGGGAAPAAAKKFALSEEVVIRMDIENDMQQTGVLKQLSGVIDAAGKAGLAFGTAGNNIYARMGLTGGSGIAQFGLDEGRGQKLRTEAYAAAFKDAKTRGAALAALAGGRLGKVVSVQEIAAPAEESKLESIQVTWLAQLAGGGAGSDDGAIDHNGRIQLKQQIAVTFELVD